MQLNSTYYRATKAIPYEVVFNRKPNYRRTPLRLRQIDENKIENQEIDDEEDISLIHEAVNQVTIERRIQQLFKVPNPDKDPEY